jgi:sugar phosphate isomerase/epimerase
MPKFATYAGLWTHLPIEERIATIAEAGFDAVCLDFEREMARTEGPWEAQMRLAEKYHLPVENVHLSGEGMNAVWAEGDAGEAVTQRLIAELRDMASLGVKVGVAHVTWGHGFPEGRFEAGLARYERAVETAEKYGVTLALENSVFPQHVHYLLSHIKSPSLGFCYDSGHENAFTPAEDYLSQYSDIVVALHLHDNDGKIDNHWVPFHPLGTIDWQKKAEQLKKTALFHRMVTLEANPEGENLLDAFRAALASAKRLADL